MRLEFSKKLPAKWRGIAKVLTALGHDERQRILLLFEAGEQLNVSQLVEASTLSRTAVSHHLRILHEAGILRRRKVGKEVFFRLDTAVLRTALGDVLEYIDENYK